MDENNKLSSILRYHLVQYTPMIHFQFNENGACIRPSELKPKLDEFLHHKMGEDIREDFFINGEKNALNYKVRVAGIGTPEISDKINPMYFGNMGSDASNFKQTVFYNHGLSLEILCFIPDLRDCIDKNIREFFLTTNFGTRQNKGFGSFAVEGSEEDMKRYLDASGCYYFYTRTKYKKVKDLQNVAATIYAMMKGGINRNNLYVKGYIQRKYFDDLNEKGIGSEKAMIKSSMLTLEGAEKEKYTDYQYSRALLGLADHYTFRKERIGNIEIHSDELERFKSPLTIKIIKSDIYFIFDDSYKKILGEKMVFSVQSAKTAIKEKKKTISVPESFDPNSFIDGFIKYFEEKKAGLGVIAEPFGLAKDLVLEKGGKTS